MVQKYHLLIQITEREAQYQSYMGYDDALQIAIK